MNFIKKIKYRLQNILILATLLAFNAAGTAEVISSDKFGYSVDFPEMFEIADCSEDERSVLFEHTLLPVQTVIRVWPAGSYSTSVDAINSTAEKLSASSQTSAVKWRNRDCAVSKIDISAKVLGQEMSGWGVCVPLYPSKDFLTILCYAPKDKAFDCEQMILSVLDCLMVDKGSFSEAGIITRFAFPRTQSIAVELEIGGKKITTELDKEDSEANKFVVDREFAVFKLFASQKCWKEAWQRFYRIIAKDASGRVKKAAFDISSAIYTDCVNADPSFPEAAMAQKVLSWTQTFSYERPSATADKADFTDIPSTLCGKGSDCDSRSMLVMILCRNMGLDSIMLVSVDYSHAMAGVCMKGKQGQSFSLDGKDYLFGETTAKGLTFGMIAKDMQDKTKWIPIELYD